MDLWTKHQVCVVKFVFTRSLLAFPINMNVLACLRMWGDLFSRDHYRELPRTYRRKKKKLLG